MLIFEAVIFGLVQALSEFLPVSSSGHLIILHQLWPSPLLDNLTFDTMLHGGTLVAILWFFWQDWLMIIKSLWLNVAHRQAGSESRLGWAVVVGTIPAAAVGFFLESFIESLFRQIWLVATMLLVFALVLAWVERHSRKNKNLTSLTIGHGWWIGVCQILALVPGVSRSGITATSGLLFGLNRQAAVRFSFLLSAPIIAGAFLSQLLKISWLIISPELLWSLAVGFIVSAIAGY